MSKKRGIPRRSTLKGIGAVGAFAMAGAGCAGPQSENDASNGVPSVKNIRPSIAEKVAATPFIDTHEHLLEEKSRLSGTAAPRVMCDDWAYILSHYLDSDLLSAGMPQADYDRFFSPEVNPLDKWKLIAPWWSAVKQTGYGQAVVIAIRELYGVDELSADTVKAVQAGYERVRKPGFYHEILNKHANIESCQVNSLEGTPFMETSMPDLLMQDMSIVGMFAGGGDIDSYAIPANKQVNSLSDWHGVIDWWFEKYGKYATAVKSQNAYSRNIDYEDIQAENAEPIFNKRLSRDKIDAAEMKMLEDHLFWYSARKATEYDLPVKLHTGYYAQWVGKNDRMPLGRLMMNPAAVTDLCDKARDTRFVFMHICYPYYEDMIAAAKQNPNAYLDMCWAWIINPVASKDFLKKYLVTAPANKVLTLGADYIPVEPVLGHAVIARNGITLALSELVDDGWMSEKDALALVDPIMHGNARSIFRIEEKGKKLGDAEWL